MFRIEPELLGREPREGGSRGRPPPPDHLPTLVYSRIIISEIVPLCTALKKVTAMKWSRDKGESSLLLQPLQELMTTVSTLQPSSPPLPPLAVLDPFLSVIKSEDTTGPITKEALSAVNRLISYGLLDPLMDQTDGVLNAAIAAENIASAVTRARFVGTEAAADEAVLFGILWVLRELFLSRAGLLLSNDSVCEILNSAFRICFETRLSDLLRTYTEEALREMVVLIFSRLSLHTHGHSGVKKVKIPGSGRGHGRVNRSQRTPAHVQEVSSGTSEQHGSYEFECTGKESGLRESEGQKEKSDVESEAEVVVFQPDSEVMGAGSEVMVTPRSDVARTEAEVWLSETKRVETGPCGVRSEVSSESMPEVAEVLGIQADVEVSSDMTEVKVELGTGGDGTKAETKLGETRHGGTGTSEVKCPEVTEVVEFQLDGEVRSEGKEVTEATHRAETRTKAEVELGEAKTSDECTEGINMSRAEKRDLSLPESPDSDPRSLELDQNLTHSKQGDLSLPQSPDEIKSLKIGLSLIDSKDSGVVSSDNDALSLEGDSSLISRPESLNYETSLKIGLTSEEGSLKIGPITLKETGLTLEEELLKHPHTETSLNLDHMSSVERETSSLESEPSELNKSVEPSDPSELSKSNQSNERGTKSLNSEPNEPTELGNSNKSKDPNKSSEHSELSEPNVQTELSNSSKSKDSNKSSEPSDLSDLSEPYTNSQGVKFTSSERSFELSPFGLPCTRELLRFLISLTSRDESNTQAMILASLKLITVALEVSFAEITKCESLMSLVRESLCKNLTRLISGDTVAKLPVYSVALRLIVLICESLRAQIKFQFEILVGALIQTVSSELIPFQHRELALSALIQVFRIDGLPTELFLNYDCDLYSASLLESSVKTFSKLVFPVDSNGLIEFNFTCLDALIWLVEGIERRAMDQGAQITEFEPGEPTAPNEKAQTRKLESSSESKTQVGNDCTTELKTNVESEFSSGDSDMKFEGQEQSGSRAESSVIAESGSAEVHTSSRDHGRDSSCEVGVDTSNYDRSYQRDVLRAHSSQKFMIRHELTDARALNVDEFLKRRRKKIIITTATDLFNTKPERGIKHLMEHDGIDPSDSSVADFLRRNPGICKKALGSYISSRKNINILRAFVNSFDFTDLRIDQALRVFLEAFRLPGEAPLISLILETFAEAWYAANGRAQDVRSPDAAFTLSYAVIMLNVDQHNPNAKKQAPPMTLDQFVSNLRDVNDRGNFRREMLERIFMAVKKDEFVLPSEQAGPIREDYIWRLALSRSNYDDPVYYLANRTSLADRDIFLVSFGSILSALNYTYDKVESTEHLTRIGLTYRTLASVAMHLNISECLDNIIVTLCKFTSLAHVQTQDQLAVSLGSPKARLALREAIELVALYGDLIRDGWRNVADLLLHIYNCQILPDELMEGLDFTHPAGKIKLLPPPPPPSSSSKSENSLLSSLYSYIVEPSGSTAQPISDTGDGSNTLKLAKECVSKCRIPRILSESLYLRTQTLIEFTRALLDTGIGGETGISGSEPGIAESAEKHDPKLANQIAYLLEITTRVLSVNKDRIYRIYPAIHTHIRSILSRAAVSRDSYLLNRVVASVVQITQLLLRTCQRPAPLKWLQIHLSPTSMALCGRQIMCGFRQILTPSLSNNLTRDDWGVILSLIEYAAAGVRPQIKEESVEEESQEDGLEIQQQQVSESTSRESPDSNSGWILVGAEEVESAISLQPDTYTLLPPETSLITLSHSPHTLRVATVVLGLLSKCYPTTTTTTTTTTTLAGLTTTARILVEASLHGGIINKLIQQAYNSNSSSSTTTKKSAKTNNNNNNNNNNNSNSNNNNNNNNNNENENGFYYNEEMEDLDKDGGGVYLQISEKLLDILSSLHAIAGQLTTTTTTTTTTTIWNTALCPLLKGMARLCCDSRPNVRGQALTTLQRSLLSHDYYVLSASQWESLFHQVLFPLLSGLVELPTLPQFKATATTIHQQPTFSPQALEETRLRAVTLVMKVYLRHLHQLLTLQTFTALWLTILDFLERYLSLSSDYLREAVPEMVKNMVLVMETTHLFHTSEGYTDIWQLTWSKIDTFLPSLRAQIFNSHPPSDIHNYDADPVTTKEDGLQGKEDGALTPLDQQKAAATLSLSQENIPEIIENSSVILQPPLPSVQTPPSNHPIILQSLSVYTAAHSSGPSEK